jgi:hypothetical protein
MKKLFCLCALLFFSQILISQKLEINWSEQFKYDNKIDGFFQYYVGTTEELIYAKFANLALRPKKMDKKIKLIAFDKKTMKKVAEVQLKGYGKENSENDYYRTIVFEKMVYVIWTKESKKKVECFAQSFDNKLKKLSQLTKIYEYPKEKGASDNITILSNIKASKLMIIKEFPITKDDENLKVEYKVLNSDLTFGAAHQVTFPILFSKKRRGLFSSLSSGFKVNYELGADGNLYVSDLISMDEDDKKNLKKGESSVYTYFAQVTSETGNLRDYKVKFANKNTFKVNYIIDKGKIKLYGFFSDLNKDVKGNDSHGIFYISINSNSFKEETANFEYFDKKMLDVLYAKDKEDQKEGKGLFKSKKAKKSDEESLNDSYVIEQIISDGEYLTLFCSIMYNYSRQVCTTNSNGGTTCRTEYYCNKRNVTVFKLNSTGKIIWATNLDRDITYSGTSIYDVRAIKDKYNYFVIYGTQHDLAGNRKRRGTAYFNEKLEYATFSVTDGKYKEAEYMVNAPRTKKKEKKSIRIMDIVTYDNKMFTQTSRIRRKPIAFLTCLLPPVYLFMQFNSNLMRGTGYLGGIITSG